MLWGTSVGQTLGLAVCHTVSGFHGNNRSVVACMKMVLCSLYTPIEFLAIMCDFGWTSFSLNLVFVFGDILRAQFLSR